MDLRSGEASTTAMNRRCPWRDSVGGLSLAILLVGAISACVARPAPPVDVKAPREAPVDARLVAAGVLKGDMTTRSNVLNDLRIVRVASGQMTITFDGYRKPEGSSHPAYTVKAVACQIGGMVVPSVAVESFTADGIVLRITDPEGKLPLPLKYLITHEFTISVSEMAL